MGKNIFQPIAVLLCILITISACKKTELVPDEGVTNLANAKVENSQRTDNRNNAKNLLLKQMTIDGRTYTFYYNKKGAVDSVAIGGDTKYTYQVTYAGARITSVALVEGGVTLATNSNFSYHGNNITGYDYQWIADGPEFKISYAFEYDNKGRIVTQKRNGGVELRITYDKNNNVRTWNDRVYTSYDNNLNPLYYVDNLFAIFVEEPFIWEYAFSQHNTSGGGIINKYNASKQLVKKVAGYNFLFSYY